MISSHVKREFRFTRNFPLEGGIRQGFSPTFGTGFKFLIFILFWYHLVKFRGYEKTGHDL